MNTPINKSIFNETGCIRKELLVKYRDDNLGPDQKHEVEEHLVDCALCSEALEGIALLSGTAALDAVQQEVSKITHTAAAVSLRPWLAAATIAGMIAISYFTYLQYKNVKEERLAISLPEQKAEEKSYNNNQAPVSVTSDSAPAISTPVTTISDKEPVELKKAATAAGASGVALEQELAAEEIVAAETQEVSVKSENNVQLFTVAPAAKDASSFGKPYNNTGNQNITYVDNVKVIDYTEYDVDNIKKADEPRSTPSQYQNKTRAKEAAAAEEKSGIVVKRKADYIDLVADPIILFNNGRYESANSGFDELLKINNNDQNAAFYKGLSLYNLNRYDPAIRLLEPISNDSVSPFMEEAKYYTAKSYINKGNLNKGKVILEEIVNTNGFYSKQAGEELKNIK